MHFRIATIDDIPEIREVRNSVKENMLSDPTVVTYDDTVDYLVNRGRGWVCEMENRIVGFGIADLADHSIWALFVHPDFERIGIGWKLHEIMLSWYFSHTQHTIWLVTDAPTRSEQFYRRAGWIEVGKGHGNELRFEMSYNQWLLH